MDKIEMLESERRHRAFIASIAFFLLALIAFFIALNELNAILDDLGDIIRRSVTSNMTEEQVSQLIITKYAASITSAADVFSLVISSASLLAFMGLAAMLHSFKLTVISHIIYALVYIVGIIGNMSDGLYPNLLVLLVDFAVFISICSIIVTLFGANSISSSTPSKKRYIAVICYAVFRVLLYLLSDMNYSANEHLFIICQIILLSFAFFFMVKSAE